jgi:hypothetical protein
MKTRQCHARRKRGDRGAVLACGSTYAPASSTVCTSPPSSCYLWTALSHQRAAPVAAFTRRMAAASALCPGHRLAALLPAALSGRAAAPLFLSNMFLPPIVPYDRDPFYCILTGSSRWTMTGSTAAPRLGAVHFRFGIPGYHETCSCCRSAAIFFENHCAVVLYLLAYYYQGLTTTIYNVICEGTEEFGRG